jgi:hypothetical protein
MRRIKAKSGRVFFSFLLVASLFFVAEEGRSQPASTEAGKPQIELGGVTFRTREIESKPDPMKMLEIHIEVLNRSREVTAPAHSTKVVVTPTETRFSAGKPADASDPPIQEIAVNVELPPGGGRAVLVGFSLPKENLTSITFEIQVNPPEGNKKTITWSSE